MGYYDECPCGAKFCAGTCEIANPRRKKMNDATMEQIAKAQADDKAKKERKELLAWTAADALQVASEVDLRRKAELDKAVDDELLEVLKNVKKQSEAGETKLTLAVAAHKDAIIDRLIKKGFRYNATSNIVEWGHTRPPVYR